MSYKVNLGSRNRIKLRIGKKVKGTSKRPRLSVFRSLSNIYANLVDDSINKTLFSISTLSKEVKAELNDKMSNISKSKVVGKILAKKAIENKIKKIVFDRNGYLYHGRVKSLAEGAREGGLEF